MRESTWRGGKSPARMLEFILGKASARRLRLFACACARLHWASLNDQGRQAVAAAEAYADDPATFAAMKEAGDALPDYGLVALTYYAALARACTFVRATEAARAAFQRRSSLQGPTASKAALLHCLFGIPHRRVTADPLWRTQHDGAAVRLARSIYFQRAWEQLPILADALEDAGCTNEDVLNHCRQGTHHARGCWVLEMLLEPEAGPGCPAEVLQVGQAVSTPVAPTRLFLPHAGWLVQLQAPGTTDFLPPEPMPHVRPWRRSPADEVLLAGACDPGELKDDPLVRSVQRVWFVSSGDPVPVSSSLSGRREQDGEVRTVLYTDREKALEDLAPLHEPIRLLGERQVLAYLLLGG